MTHLESRIILLFCSIIGIITHGNTETNNVLVCLSILSDFPSLSVTLSCSSVLFIQRLWGPVGAKHSNLSENATAREKTQQYTKDTDI